MAQINQKIRRQINRELAKNIQTFHDDIPAEEISKSLQEVGYFLAQEDGTPLSGIFCGAEGSTLLRIAPVFSPLGTLVENAGIALSWYKMRSGRYEIVAYLS